LTINRAFAARVRPSMAASKARSTPAFARNWMTTIPARKTASTRSSGRFVTAVSTIA